MRAPWSRKPERPVHAIEPHEFRPVRDAGTATGLGAVSNPRSGIGGIAGIAITNRYLRMSACAVPGCGKSREDPIHAAAE
jgi:hypothetical protein